MGYYRRPASSWALRHPPLRPAVFSLLAPLASITNRAHDAVEHRYANFLPYAFAHPGQILGIAFATFLASLVLVPGLGVDLEI